MRWNGRRSFRISVLFRQAGIAQNHRVKSLPSSRCPHRSLASSRRKFLAAGAGAALGSGLSGALTSPGARAAEAPKARFQFGLVTYQWGRDWDLPTLLKHCEAADVLGVELRTTHAHGVEPSLNEAQRAEVKKRFEDSPVVCLGPGSNERFDNPDPAVVREAIEASKAFLQLSHDIGGSGVKVKPDRFYDDIPREKTIAQIGAALRELATFGDNLGQEVRLEVHGGLREPVYIEKVIAAADHPNARVCWNSNDVDTQGDGLKKNFDRVRRHFGATCHIHDLKRTDYPWAELFELLSRSEYEGWVLLEEGKVPEDPAAELVKQRKLFDKLISDDA